MVQGTGEVLVKLVVECIIFKPLVDQVLVAKVLAQNPNGICARVGLVNIFIPARELPEVSQFDEVNNSWNWHYKAEQEEVLMAFELSKQIKVRVQSLCFDKQSQIDQVEGQLEGNLTSAFYAICSCKEEGLGMAHWWQEMPSELHKAGSARSSKAK